MPVLGDFLVVFDVLVGTLRGYFEQFGDIDDCRMIKDKVTSKNVQQIRGFSTGFDRFGFTHIFWEKILLSVLMVVESVMLGRMSQL